MENGGIRVTFDPATEMASPRFRAIIRATSGRRKRPTSANIKSFSLEFNCRGPHRFRIQKLRPFTNPDGVMMLVRSKFNRLKQEVNAELGIFAGDVVSTLESTRQDDHELRVQLEDLLLIAQKCAEMTPDDFWSKCEGFVQSLDDRRQELPMGILKQAHTRFLFILTRCTRLLQFHQEGAFGEGGHHVLGRHQFSDLGYYPEQTTGLGLKGSLSSNAIKDKLIKKKLHEHGLSSGYQNENFAGHIYSDGSDTDSPGSRERMSSWKKLPSAAEKNQKKSHSVEDDNMSPKKPSTVDEGLEVDDESLNNESNTGSEAQQVTAADSSTMICRICDFVIPTLHAESHFKVCSIVDRCDVKGGSVEERLEKIADILEKILEPCTSVTDGMCVGDEHVNLTVSSSTDNIECFPEKSPIMNGDNGLPSVSCNKSPGSMTPRSPLLTAQPSQVDLLLTVKSALSELENLQQIKNLLDIVHCIKGVQTKDYSSLEYLSSYLEDLNDVIDNRKVDALIVETFGRRIEKLLQEKFILLCAQIDDGNKDSSGLDLDDDSSVDNDRSHGSSSHPLSAKLKDRTSIEDFEIIKPVSRGAFGRVFLAKKRVTGDLFAIKVLKKADMIRKNAVESILAERNILISIRNPFVVRFYYSFTCRENLYLVMEYLNGGDLYSLLRNLGCLEEEMARTYVAELVLALEYLHSQSVIHRDLKPDNLLIARNGHIKLTDFGLSKVGLINSTDDLSGPDVSSAALLDEHKPMPASVRAEIREQRRKQSAVGTPDYLAPEILLGMTHGQTADWWSVGVILFELLVGIPPFNAGHPQKIFDNIMNRDIPWPQVPEELSYDAYDLIDKLLMQNPVQRLGATGAGEVKSHPFFKSINWDMLAKQKAAFIPSTEGEDDTSYFACRHDWNPDDVQIQTPLHYDDSTDSGSLSCSSSPYSCANDEDEDEFGSMAEFGAPKKYSFSNFSFKNISQLANINYDLITKCNEDEANAKSPCEKTET